MTAREEIEAVLAEAPPFDSRYPTKCRFGYVEDDGDQYCFEHFGWHHYTDRTLRCSLWDAA